MDHPVLKSRQRRFELHSNLVLTVRDERGKLVTKHRGRNIWMNTGRQLLSQLITATAFSPSIVPEASARPLYIGLGIGGERQSYMGYAASPPYSNYYPGTNSYSDRDARQNRLERPVRFSWVTGSPTLPTGSYPSLTYDAGDVFLRQIDAAPTMPTPTSVQFLCSIGLSDFSSDIFTAVPLSEIGLFSSLCSVNDYADAPLAYDTFPTIEKTGVFSMLVDWTIRL